MVIIVLIKRIILLILHTYFIVSFLRCVKVLNLKKLHQVVSYAVSIATVSVVHFVQFERSFQYSIVFLVSTLSLILIFFPQTCNKFTSKCNCESLKARYITNLFIYTSIRCVWLHPNCLVTILFGCCWFHCYYFGQPHSKIYSKITKFLKYVIDDSESSKIFITVILLFHIIFLSQHFNTFVLFDLYTSTLLLVVDDSISNVFIIRTSVKYGFNIKPCDESKLISKWKTNTSPEYYAKVLLDLSRSKKLSKVARKRIINLGSANNKLITDSFISIFLAEIQSESDEIFDKTNIMNLILQKVNLDHLSIVDLVNLSNNTNESNKDILRKSMTIFENTGNEITERIYVSNALMKQIYLNPTFVSDPEVIDTFKSIALKNKSKIFSSKEILISSIALQCLKSVLNELPYDFYEDYYKINIRLNLSSRGTCADTLSAIKAAELSKLDKRLASHTLTPKKRFSLLETLSVILYSGYTIDTSIFTHFSSNEWHRELLIYVLLGKALEYNSLGWNEMKVKEFMEHMNILKDMINRNVNNERLSIMQMENVLKSLINKQHKYNFNLSQIVDILIVTQAQIAHIDILLNNDSDNFIQELADMELLWLRKICDDQQILRTEKIITSPSNSRLYELHQLLGIYDVSTVKIFLNKVQKKSNISDLISFLNSLNNSPLTHYNKHVFLRKLGFDSITAWKCQLSQFLVHNVIANEFPNYKSSKSNKITIPGENGGMLNKIKRRLNKIFVDKSEDKQSKCIKSSNEDKQFDNLNHTDSNEYNELTNELVQMESKLAKLLSLGGWSIKIIAYFVQNLDSLQKIQELSKSIDIIIEYNLKEEEDIIDLINTSCTADLGEKVHQYAIKKTFSGTYEKTLDTLFHEIKELNEHKNIEFLQEDTLRKAYDEVLKAYYGNSVLSATTNSIKDWAPNDINNWAASFKVSQNETLLQPEKIAVIKKAMELSSNIIPRSIQIISLLLMLNPANEKGRLAQINTGEGKTSIIAMVAAYHALHNHKVDIVTTSPVLAMPQSEQQRKFYSMLNLSVSHNVNNISGYLADICYGPVLDFEADVLRDECNKSGRRHGRHFDIVIVDEVDSMFIDGNNHIVMLATNMPGMNNLETLLAAIVIQIDAVVSSIKEIDGTTYYLQTQNRINDDGTIKAEGEINAMPLSCTKEKFIKDATVAHLRKLVRDNIEVDSGYPEVQVPNYLRDFVCNIQIPKWIDSAIRAKYVYENTKHYLLRKGKVLPVDAQNTGIVQENQHWSNGMHQFLQMKHGAKLYPESLTNNFISNVGYFRRYTNKIYGLTGTLGDTKSSSFLEKVYGVDTVIIPPFKKKQHVELLPLIYTTESTWLSDIVNNCVSKLKRGRAVLVITKFIKEIDDLYEHFNKIKYNNSKILLFKTDEDVHVVDKVIKPGEVILTTNIAGRGTDIKLAESINEKGGLHVCLTFLPINTRVEKQNIGRTSRTGNRGTSQLMLLNSRQEINDIKRDRDDTQRNIISKSEKDVEVVITKEMIFAEFLTLLEQVRGRDSDKKAIEVVAVQERFALWLRLEEHFINNKTRSEVLKHFQEFKESILYDDQRSRLIKNPYFHVLIGRKLMNTKQYKNAIAEFTLAINLDQNFSEHAFYNRGYCLIAQYGKNMSGNKYYIDDAIGDFKKARQSIQKRETDLHLIQQASSSEMFSEQVQHKMNLYNIQKQAIDLAIGPDICEIDEQIKALKKRLESLPKDNSADINNIKDSIHAMETDKKRKGIIDEVREKNRNIEIKLIHMSECLPDNEMETYTEEIQEFNRNGFIGGFNISEIKPIDWKAVFGLLILGLGQLIAGAALAIYSLGSGATLAMSLISEGISDIISAVKDGIINRDFSWATWAIQKAISVTVAIVCAGMSAIKDAANTVSSGVKMLGKKVITETVKSGWKLVAMKIGTELAKGIAKEIVTDLANYGLEMTLIPKVQEKLVELIEGPIQESLKNNEYIKMMLKIDAKNQNNNYENFIKSAAFDILDTTCKSKLLEVGKNIAVGIADGKIKYFSTGRKITEAIMAVNDLSTLVPQFINKLNKSIEEKATSDHLMEKESESVNVDTQQNEQHQSDKEENNNTNRPTATQSTPEIPDIKGDIHLKKEPEEQVKSEKKKTKKIKNVSQLSKVIVGSVSMKMLSTIKGKMINPALQVGVNYSMEKITSGLDSTLNRDIENYRSLKRVIHYQNKGYQKNSNDKSINKDMKANDTEIGKANRLIEDARSGEKCGLPHLGAMSDVTGQPIEVYDEKGRLKFTIGDTKNGEPLKVQHHKDIEHYTILGNKEPLVQGKGDNMCLFNAISEQTGIQPDVLKIFTLKWMECNKETLSKQSCDITRLEVYDSLKLCLGGAQYSGQNAKDATSYIDQSQNNIGHSNSKKPNYVPPPGHPRGHASNLSATDPHASVEEYSKTDPKGKTGFDSYEAQDFVAHHALLNPKVQAKINQLNATGAKDSYRQVVKLTAQELNLPNNPELTKGGKWVNGVKVAEWQVQDVVLVLQHHKNKHTDAKAPVFIQTIYPLDPPP